MSIADRSILSCWGVGRQGGRPFQVAIDAGGPHEREVDALADAEPVRAGEVIRIRTTGGGGWGDPLDRPYDEVARDVLWGKVSATGARDDYGVVVGGTATHRSSTRPPATRCARRGARRAASSRSSTAAPATHGSPAGRPAPTWTGSADAPAAPSITGGGRRGIGAADRPLRLRRRTVTTWCSPTRADAGAAETTADAGACAWA